MSEEKQSEFEQLGSLTLQDPVRPSHWEDRFEKEINQLFDDAIDRLPRFVERHFKSFSRVMGRNLSPRAGIGDLYVGLRNLASAFSEAVGGPEFETTTFTEDQLSRAFEQEVLSPFELEAMLGRLFTAFEDDLWDRFQEDSVRGTQDALQVRDRFRNMIDEEIAHDPKLAQAIRSGVHLGIPITLGYFLFGRTASGTVDNKLGRDIGLQDVTVFQRLFQSFRGKTEPRDDDSFFQDFTGNALGITGAVLGSLVVGGVLEYAYNSLRDLKGSYIRQINTARYVLLYGTDPSDPDCYGILQIVRAIERRFETLPGLTEESFRSWLTNGLAKPLKNKEKQGKNSRRLGGKGKGNASTSEVAEKSTATGTEDLAAGVVSPEPTTASAPSGDAAAASADLETDSAASNVVMNDTARLTIQEVLDVHINQTKAPQRVKSKARKGGVRGAKEKETSVSPEEKEEEQSDQEE